MIPFVQGLKGLTEGFMVRTFLYCDHGSTQVNGSYMEKMEVGGGPEYSDDTMHTSRKDLCIRGDDESFSVMVFVTGVCRMSLVNTSGDPKGLRGSCSFHPSSTRS